MKKSLAWWYWLVTVILLGMGLLGGYFVAFHVVIALTAVQVVHFAWRTHGLTTFPVQVRVAYLGLLLLALWEPLRFVFLIQLIGTTAMVTVNYCFLARCLSLLPWNRTQPLSWRLIWLTFFSPPVSGRIRVDTQQSSVGSS